MNEFTFKPKYDWFSTLFLGLLCAFVLGGLATMGWAITNQFLIVFIMVSLIIVIGVANRPRLITFQEKGLVIKRFLYSDLVFLYKDFSDINEDIIWFGGNGIGLKSMNNSRELFDLFSKISEEKSLHVTGKYAQYEKQRRKIITYASALSSFIFLVVSYIARSFFDIQIGRELVGLSVYIIGFLSIYYFIKPLPTAVSPVRRFYREGRWLWV